jgi:hypothetical protein
MAKTNQLNLKDTSSETQYIVEEDEVDQAKLNMGYRFPTPSSSSTIYCVSELVSFKLS